MTTDKLLNSDLNFTANLEHKDGETRESSVEIKMTNKDLKDCQLTAKGLSSKLLRDYASLTDIEIEKANRVVWSRLEMAIIWCRYVTDQTTLIAALNT